MTPIDIATVDDLMCALWDAQDATSAVILNRTSSEYDLSLSTLERDERFGSGTLECALPQITKNVTIDIDTLLPFATIIGDGAFRLLYVAQGASLTLNHLELTNGDVGAMDTSGGAIFNDGTLTVQNCQLHDNKSNYGGAILNNRGQTNISNCDIFDNQADGGGGLYNYLVANGCVMTVTDSRIATNQADKGGGIYNEGTLTVTHCMITGNEASQGGGRKLGSKCASYHQKHAHYRKSKFHSRRWVSERFRHLANGKVNAPRQ